MLAFVVGNTNFNFHRNDNRNTIKSTRKLKSLVIETKKKMDRVVSLSPDACFEDSGIIIDGEDQTLISTFKEHTVLRNSSISLVKSDDDLQKKFFRIGSKINNVEKKIINYKTIIKWLDLFASIMIIAGCIISQVENEHFYYDNIYDRVEVVKLITDLNVVNSDVSKINFSNYNISYMLEKNENLIKNLNFTNYQELPIPLLISDYGVNMRLIICILTIACIPLIVLGRYLEFIREFQYIEKLDSK